MNLQSIFEKTILLLKNDLNVEKSNIIEMFLTGSRVYQTATEKSDWDIIVVVSKDLTGKSINRGDVNVNLFSKEDFNKQIKEGKMIVLESIFASDEFKYYGKMFPFVLEEDVFNFKTEKNIKETFNKAYKNIHIEHNYLLGTKQLFHVIRTIEFAKQIKEHGKIVDFAASNKEYKKMFSHLITIEDVEKRVKQFLL